MRNASTREEKEDRYSVICKHCGKGFKAISGSHLRYKHCYLDEHPIMEYKHRFGVAWAHCSETLEKLRKAIRSRMRWNRPRVLAEIRKIARIRRKHGFQVPVRVREAAQRLFGSWKAAVLAAKLNYDQFTKREMWTADRVRAAIRVIAQRRRRRRAGTFGRVPQGLWLAARRHFKTWQAAVRAAGQDYEQFAGRKRWSAARVVAAIRDLARRRRREATGQPAVLRQAALRYFPSWNAAVRAAGLDPRSVRRLRWDREARHRRKKLVASKS